MALDLNYTQPNYLGGAVDAFDMGRQIGKQMAVKNALDMYGDDPSGAQSALIKAGDLDGASQLSQVRAQQQNLTAMQAAGKAAAGGDYTAAAQTAASLGDPGLAGQYAGIQPQLQASAAPKTQAIVAFSTQMQQDVPNNPSDPAGTIAKRKAYLQANAPSLHQVGITDGDIQAFLDHGDADFTDQGIQNLRAAATAQGYYKPMYQEVGAGSSLVDQRTGKVIYQAPRPNIKQVRDPVTGDVSYVDMGVAGTQTPAAAPDGSQAPTDPSAAGGQTPAAAAAGQPANALPSRNNNPGDLRWDGKSQWQGMTGVDSNGFVQFDSPANGERAARVNLANQQTLHGVNTLTDLVNKYAPPGDHNDTAGYIQSVAAQTGFSPTQTLDLHDKATQDKVLAAMFNVEGGGTPARVPAPPGASAPTSTATSSGSPSTSTQAPGSPRVIMTVPGMSGQTPQATIDYYAGQYLHGGTSALPQGRDVQSIALRNRVVQRALELAPGQVDANVAHATLKSATDSLTQNQSLITAAQPALDHLPYLENRIITLAQAANQSNIPWVNGLKQWAAGNVVSDPNLKPLIDIMGQYRDAYSTAAAGKGGSSDTLRNDIADRISTKDGIATLQNVFAENRKSAQDRIAQLQDESQTLKDSISSTGPSGSTHQPATTPAAATPTQQTPPPAQGINGYTPEQVQAHRQIMAAGQNGASGTAANPYFPRTPQEYNWIKPGMTYVDTDGLTKVKR